MMPAWLAQLRTINPAMAIAVAIFIASVLVLLASYVLVFVRDQDHQVLGAYSQATVLTTVTDFPGPAVIQGGTLSIGQERCVNSSHLVQVEVTIYFRNLNDPPAPVVPFLDRAAQARAPGCNFAVITLPLPAKVTPGTWRIEGISRAIESSEVRYWVSEPFEVVSQR